LIDISSIHITDQVLAQFTFAAASGVGAFVAVSFGLLMLMLDRFERLEQEARQATTAAANSVHEVLAKHANSSGNYIARLDGYLPFVALTSSLASAYADKPVPRFVEWRSETNDILKASITFSSRLTNGTDQASGREELAFQSGFSPAIDTLDDAIQQMDWVRGTRPRTLRWIKAVVILSLVLLVGLLGIGLAAVTESGVQDKWNLYGVAAVSGGLLALGFTLVMALASMGQGRASWIRKRTRALVTLPDADDADAEEGEPADSGTD
jgi:hypothetical protein